MTAQSMDPVPECALRFDTAATLIDASCRILALARRQLVICSRDLDAPILDQAPVLQQLHRLAISGRGAQVRVLVQDPARPLRDGHRLIEQARRLSSIYQIRQVLAEDLQFTGAFMVNDRAGFVSRSFADRYEGEGHTHDSARANALLRYFNEVWERAQPASGLRALSL